tara:strand:+ start:2930 stop:3259 length:330 start_codon:yes stop_codon:yes gene_type:complete
MPIPRNISNNSADIYEASLLYEQNAKCGTTRIITGGEGWSWATLGEKCWKIVVLQEVIFATFAADNISVADCNKLIGNPLVTGTILMGDFTSLDLDDGLVILYMDCSQS